MIRTSLLLGLACMIMSGQAKDPTYDPLQKAYAALRAREYEDAITYFRSAVAADSSRPAVRKDLAYTYLKIGENEAALDQFSEAMRLDPSDHHVALEYAFLAYESGKRATARQIFDRIRRVAEPPLRDTAETAFQNVDRPLAEGIVRWKQALNLSPHNFSAHQELAVLAEERGELQLAAEQYEAAWKLKPKQRSLLVDLGRVLKDLNLPRKSEAALLAASRGGEPRVADRARELLPQRYPYVYEFRTALEMDPDNVELRRELAYLLLEMGQNADAEQEFLGLVELRPDDLLSAAQVGFLRLGRKDTSGAMPFFERVLEGENRELADRVRSELGLPKQLAARPEEPDSSSPAEAKVLAEKSYEAGYLSDALKYLRIANEIDPLDFGVMLQLGRTYNVLQRDEEAVEWFKMAGKSPDPVIARQGEEAYENLRPSLATFRTSAWLFPFYSSRWHDMFSYGQIKAEVRLGKLPVRPYISVRFIGDTSSVLGEGPPEYLSENAFIFGVGLSTDYWHGLRLWGEAGTATRYLDRGREGGHYLPDYRGGVSFGKYLGRSPESDSGGFFLESSNDGVFISRFENDTLIYSQNRFGYTLPRADALGGFQSQLFWSGNVTADVRRLYWANYVESGPGLRFRWRAMPKSLFFTVNLLRGAYTLNTDNPRRPNYFDVRVGFSYAITH